MGKLKNILKCINKNALIAFCFTLLFGVFGYLYIRNFKKLSEEDNKQMKTITI
jgi:positive regulator of sigma E activity